LQKYWQYIYNRVHRNRSHILKYAEQWFMASLATSDDFHAAIPLFKALNTCKNMLENKPAFETNPDFVARLLQGLRRNVDSVPAENPRMPEIRQDFISVLEDLIRIAQPGVPISAATITIALGVEPALPRPAPQALSHLG
jgi:hypothetical protein